MRKHVLGAILVLLTLTVSLRAMTEQERRDYRDHLLQILPDVPSFDDWVKTTNELPPDFDSLPRHNALPDPLKFLDGRAVKTAADWAARREEIKTLYEKYDIGSIPPKPKLDSVEAVSETTDDAGVTTRVVTLHYGPDSKASLQVTVIIPKGDGPFPVLMEGTVGFNAASAAATNAAIVKRGYIACTYPNSVDQLTNLPQLYPDYDFGTEGQQALNAQMVVDYLYTLPQVDKARIAITGYSRLGKLAVIAAAFDDRIAAVIAGSTGVGGVVPWRLAGERNQAESIQSTTMMFPMWFTPRLRYFVGREDRLPIDGNLLVALLAPRACLIEYGLNDEVSNDFASEAVLKNVTPLFQMAGKPDAVGLLRLPGSHGTNNMDLCMDWLDIQFGRSTAKWDNRLLFPWDFDQWRQRQTDKFDLASFPVHQADEMLVSSSGKTIASTADWETKAADIRKNVNWMLGESNPVNESVAIAINPVEGVAATPRGGPPGAAPARGTAASTAPTAGTAIIAGTVPGRGAAGARGAPAAKPVVGVGSSVPAIVAGMVGTNGVSSEFGWLDPERSATTIRTLTFGDNLKGDLYYPANAPAGAKLPTVIWLHGYSFPLGYMWVYKRDLHPILSLVAAGYAVFAYDQSGFGTRMGEFKPFYDRYPQWSQMGRLVQDVRSAIDALQKDPSVAADHISLYGYELGGTVALYTAALDKRVNGVVSYCGFTPMRTDTADKGTGGLARLSVSRGILPRLGLFIGHETQLPYDYQDILAAIAPRPALVVAPKFDRDADPADIHAAVDQAKKVYALYNAADKLMIFEPWDYARSPVTYQDWAAQWLKWSDPSAFPAVPIASAATATAVTPQ